MTKITKLAGIANKALADADMGPKIRVSASGKTLFVEWADSDEETRTPIPSHLAEEMLTLLADPDNEMDTASGIPCLNSEYVAFNLGATS